MTTKTTPFEQWAIVELFGHARIAGKLTEQAIGGCAFVRVDVPEVVAADGTTLPGFTKLFGQGAIYAISFVDEATAQITVREIQSQPVSVWNLRAGLEGLPATSRQRLLSDPNEEEEIF